MSDLISRQDAIAIIQSMYPGMPRVPFMRKKWRERYDPYIRTEKVINCLPSAQPETPCYLGNPCEYQNKDIKLTSAQQEPHYCRECKWSMCHINVDKYGSIKTYWHCLYWAGETDEEGFCHEWERNGEQP